MQEFFYKQGHFLVALVKNFPEGCIIRYSMQQKLEHIAFWILIPMMHSWYWLDFDPYP